MRSFMMLIHQSPNLGLFLGNGPSGICLSYLLSGYKPYLDTATVHPDPILYRKLQETKHLPITEQVKTPTNYLHMYVQSLKCFMIGNFISTGSGIFERRSGGEVKEPCGCTF